MDIVNKLFIKNYFVITNDVANAWEDQGVVWFREC